MRTLPKTLLVFATICVGSVRAGEWEITEVRTAPYQRKSYNGPPEMLMDVAIRNTSKRKLFVWGQDFGARHLYYHIESFIRDKDDAVWERQHAGMCATTGRIGWIEVEPGETIRSPSIVFREYAGRQMLLTLRRAFSKGDAKGAEILLGPFKVPKPEEKERPARAEAVPPARSRAELENVRRVPLLRQDH